MTAVEESGIGVSDQMSVSTMNRIGGAAQGRLDHVPFSASRACTIAVKTFAVVADPPNSACPPSRLCAPAEAHIPAIS
jgi:hypothetical protein